MAEKRVSLLDDAGEAPSAGRSKSKGGVSGDKAKLMLALGLFVVAAFVYLWLNGMLTGPAKAPPPSPQELQAFEQQQKANAEAAKSARPPVVGGD